MKLRFPVDLERELDLGCVLLEEMLSGVRVMKSFTREAHEDERYTVAIEASFKASMDRTRLM